MSEVPHSGGPSSNRELRLGQLFYGSLSGERNFRILADSGGLSRDERDVVRHYSNLGGSAQTAANPEPVWAAYPLSHGRRAFARTVFLGAAGRGNDYLAHVLILDADTLAWLRGDLFLLADLELFSAHKPSEDAALPTLTLDRERLERAAARAVGRDSRFPLPELADLLRALASGPVALAAHRSGAGTDLCRSVLSCLPPDDRRRLAFCSRFSHPRRAAFHLAVHQPEDAGLVAEGLVGFDRQRNELAATGAEADPFRHWLERAAREDRALEPVTGLSLLGRPEEAVATVAALDEWTASLPATGNGVSDSARTEVTNTDATNTDPEPSAKHRRGDALVRRAQRDGLPLLEVARHPLNRRLPIVGRLLLDATVHSLVQRIGTILRTSPEERAPFAEVATACDAAREGTRPGALLERLLRLAREASHEAVPTARPRRGGATALSEHLVHAYSAAAFALTGAGSGGARAVYSRLGEDALWRSPAEASRALLPLAAARPRAFLGLLSAWFTAWREFAGATSALDEIGPLLGRLAEGGQADTSPALHLALRALEDAAPPVSPDGSSGQSTGRDGDSGSDDSPGSPRELNGRQAWHLVLLRRLSADLGDAYPALTAARLALEGDLFLHLQDSELASLAPPLVESFPERLAARVAAGRIPWGLLRPILFSVTEGLLSDDLRGGDDLRGSSDEAASEAALGHRASLVARVATEATAGALQRRDRRAVAEVIWLLWGAVRLLPASTEHRQPGTDSDSGFRSSPHRHASELFDEAAVARLEAALVRIVTAATGEPDSLEDRVEASPGVEPNLSSSWPDWLPEADIALRALWRLTHVVAPSSHRESSPRSDGLPGFLLPTALSAEALNGLHQAVLSSALPPASSTVGEPSSAATIFAMTNRIRAASLAHPGPSDRASERDAVS